MSAPKVGEAGKTPASTKRQASEPPKGVIAVRFAGKITEKVIRLLNRRLLKNTSVCKNASELENQKVGDLMLVSPTSWDDWDSVYRSLSEKTEQGCRIYLLDNSFHAGDCADWETVLDKQGNVVKERNLWAG